MFTLDEYEASKTQQISQMLISFEEMLHSERKLEGLPGEIAKEFQPVLAHKKEIIPYHVDTQSINEALQRADELRKTLCKNSK